MTRQFKLTAKYLTQTEPFVWTFDARTPDDALIQANEIMTGAFRGWIKRVGKWKWTLATPNRLYFFRMVEVYLAPSVEESIRLGRMRAQEAL